MDTLVALRVACMRADVVTGVSFILAFGSGVNILTDAEFIAVATAVLGLAFIIKMAYFVERLAGVCDGAIIGGGTGVDVKLNANTLVTVVTALEVLTRVCFGSLAPLEKSFPCC